MTNANAVARVCAIMLTIAAPMATCGTAQAQTVGDEVRCVLLSNAVASKTGDERRRQVGAAVASYFMGRLDVRPPAQVKAAIAAQKQNITAAAAAAAMNACVARANQAEARLRALAK